jgi:hypothetical protein
LAVFAREIIPEVSASGLGYLRLRVAEIFDGLAESRDVNGRERFDVGFGRLAEQAVCVYVARGDGDGRDNGVITRRVMSLAVPVLAFPARLERQQVIFVNGHWDGATAWDIHLSPLPEQWN